MIIDLRTAARALLMWLFSWLPGVVLSQQVVAKATRQTVPKLLSLWYSSRFGHWHELAFHHCKAVVIVAIDARASSYRCVAGIGGDRSFCFKEQHVVGPFTYRGRG